MTSLKVYKNIHIVKKLSYLE